MNRELALALLTLHDLNLLPTESMDRYAVAKAGPWQAIMEKTDLPAAFPPEMQLLLRRLNPQLKSWENLNPSDEVVFVRSDVLVKVPVRRHFSAESQKAQERRDTISKNWKEYVTSEKDNTRIDLYGFELSVPVESLEVGRKAVMSILKGSQGNAFPSYRPNAQPAVGSYYADLKE